MILDIKEIVEELRKRNDPVSRNAALLIDKLMDLDCFLLKFLDDKHLLESFKHQFESSCDVVCDVVHKA